MLVQGRVGHRRLHRPVLYTSVALFSFCNLGGAHADWAETLGISQKSTNLGGAVTATSNDYDAFYTNPAGAANFATAFFGAGVKFEDVRGLNVTQSGVGPGPSALGCLAVQCGPAPVNGLSLSPVGALPGATGGAAVLWRLCAAARIPAGRRRSRRRFAVQRGLCLRQHRRPG
jgi:hypothetical protein